MIADLHLGKADAFRAAGIALPRGGTAHDLARLDALLARTAARSVWILGDMLHAGIVTRAWREAWDTFRARHPALEIVVIAGNHDAALHRAGLQITLAGDAVRDGPFEFRHAPGETADAHVVCGHLHPVVRVPGLKRLPAFWLAPGQTMLPAFSAFTGGWLIRAQPQDRIVACADTALAVVPAGVILRRRFRRA